MTHPKPLVTIAENPSKVVKFYNRWRKLIPEQFRVEACPDPTSEEYAAVKLEYGIRYGVKKFKRNQKAGKSLEMEKEALEGLVKKGKSEKGAKGRAKSTGLDDEPAQCTEALTMMTHNGKPAYQEYQESKIAFTNIKDYADVV